jgi:hypothetical protein
MKRLLKSSLLLIALSGFSAWSDDAPQTVLPREGTKILLSPEEVADLKKWIDNARQDLANLQDDLRRGTLENRRSRIVREFEITVAKSGAKENELLMRYTLNRALETDELVGKNPAPSELQSLVAFLDTSIELSKSFYTDDQKYLEAIGRGEAPKLQTPMAIFGYQYAQKILEISRTFLRPELEYRLTFAALGWLANDLNSSRNLSRIQFSDTITRIARLQQLYPMTPVGDDQAVLLSIRQFKWEYRERVLKQIRELNGDFDKEQEEAQKKALEATRLAALSESQREDEKRLAEAAKVQAETLKKATESMGPVDPKRFSDGAKFFEMRKAYLKSLRTSIGGWSAKTRNYAVGTTWLLHLTEDRSFHGKVIEIYDENRFRMQLKDGVQPLVNRQEIRKAVQEVPCLPGLETACVGSTYTTRDGGYSGKITNIFEDATFLAIDFDDNKSYERAELGDAVIDLVGSCFFGACAGQKVVEKGDASLGIIVGFRSDGTFKIKDVKSSTSFYRYRSTLLFPVTTPLFGIRVGDRVLSDGKYNGKVLHILENSTALVVDDDDNKFYIRAPEAMAKLP